ncbi:MAG: YceI family protein [Bacteroidota bacterium]
MFKQTFSLLLIGCFSLLSVSFAQVTLSVQSGSEFAVDGGSTLSDWSVKTTEISGTIELDRAFTKKGLPKKGSEIALTNLSIPVSSLDGGRGATMNDKILKAFDVTNHPDIVYELTSATVTGTDAAKKQFTMDTKGTLSMAGVSREISFPLTAEMQADGSFVFSGEYKTSFSNFEIEPPSAMFGQIICEDPVLIRLTLATAASE